MRLLPRSLALLGLGVLAGCGAPPPPATIVDRDWSAEEVLSVVQSRTGGLETLRAGLELAWPDPDTGEPRSCGGSLSYARPDRLRVRGTTKAFFTVFDLVATKDLVWLDVPREKFVVFGRRDDPAWDELPLSPDALLIALLADPCARGPCDGGVALGTETEESRSISGGGWELTVDRRTGLPTGYARTEDGALRISWKDWGVRKEMAWPSRIGIRAAERGEELEVRLGRLEPGHPIRDETFTMDPEEDREVLSPSDARDRWQRLRL